jgi:hypothetical protein
MAVNSLLTKSYATNVYLTGRTSLATLQATGQGDYLDPVMQYAADNYFIDDIEAAQARGWITPEECQTTLDLKESGNVQYRAAN